MGRKAKIVKRPWTHKEFILVLQGIGSNSVSWLCKKAGNRSYDSIRAKIYRSTGMGGITRGSFTLAELVRVTGYNVSQLKRAQKALKQKWKKTSAKGYYLITEDQFDELVAWLGLDYWSKPHRLYKCLWCHTRNDHHRSYGLCEVCYKKYENKLRSLKINRSIGSVKGFVKENLGDQQLEEAMKFLDRNRALPIHILDSL